MSWQTILVGWLVLIQYQHAEYNEVGRQCPKASWALGGLLPVSYSSGAAKAVLSFWYCPLQLSHVQTMEP